MSVSPVASAPITSQPSPHQSDHGLKLTSQQSTVCNPMSVAVVDCAMETSQSGAHECKQTSTEEAVGKHMEGAPENVVLNTSQTVEQLITEEPMASNNTSKIPNGKNTQQKITSFTYKKHKSPCKKKRKQRSSADDVSEWEVESSTTTDLSSLIEQAVAKGLNESLDQREEKFLKLISTMEKTVEDLKEGIAFRDQEIKDLQESSECLRGKVKEVEGRLLRCEKGMEDLREENIALKSRSMRDNVVFYNIADRQDNQHEDCLALLYGFIESEMKVPDDEMSQLRFDRVHRMGARQHGRGRAIVAKCSSTRTKEIIFKYVKNLRGTGYGVSEQIPPEINARRTHLMPKFRDAKAARVPTKWNFDKLVVNGVSFSKPSDQAEYSQSVPIITAVDEIKHTDITQEKGSSFQAHIVTIDDKAQVIPTLHQLFTNHSVAKATHNIYAYRIQGQGRIIENSCDDGEFGAGNKVLNVLRDQNAKNVMVIVTRWYGGVHMGPQRFNCIANSTLKALTINK